ncbi:TIGR04283 family arsenosugar biosynthesis glycosyltransferase [Phycisphaerales bacterium AB-hyl4]|uniref:TIGR04283 family arsenosugar biosynthesis glycosyltransferase n=1 Tax=Natronomicrosphaera hydrolytica TaxID=3242702 RepID=A0ABV4UA58_9BACT
MSRTEGKNLHDRLTLFDVAVIMPALNEAEAIGHVLDAIPDWVSQIIVVDNGSIDDTADVAREHGATVVREPRRGYGAACLRGLAALPRASPAALPGVSMPDVVVFLNADCSNDPSEMNTLVEPIAADEADLVIGSRVLSNARPESLSLPQRFGNALTSLLIRRLWHTPCTDLGQFRAIRFDALQALDMSDLDYGWTVQMQARALRMGYRIREVPVSYRRRIGTSKVSGTIHGIIGAGTKILTTIGREACRRRTQVAQRETLLVFTRYPEPGKTKTRLIPALGPERAARLQLQMTHRTLDAARRWACRPGRSVQVCFAGGDRQRMAQQFGHDLHYRPQCDGTLGDRLHHAIAAAHHERGCPVVVIGCDCPQLDDDTIDQAFAAIKDHDAVIGPASDGGYYLLGLGKPNAALFADIDWGTDRVRAQTQAIASQLGLFVAMLPEKHDIDEPDDLVLLPNIEQMLSQQHGEPPQVSIIIPAINEAADLPASIASAQPSRRVEVIVIDGGSTDDTPTIAATCGARVITAPPGRARQMNAGAAEARGHILLFLHADTRLPFGYERQIKQVLSSPGTVAGAFPLAFDHVSPSLRLIETAANYRSRWRQLPYGDQAMFLSRETFMRMQGYRNLPVMEDYELVRRLRKQGTIRLAGSAVVTSARRCLHVGIWRTTWTHQCMILGWHLGIAPTRLARWRRDLIRQQTADSATRTQTPVPPTPLSKQ